MSVFQRGSRFWYEFVFRGQRVRESTGSTSRNLAIRAERNRRRELEEGFNGLRTNRRPMLFPAAAQEWKAANEARWSKANNEIQKYTIEHLSGYFGNMMLIDITPQHIGRYQAKRQKEKASNRTINMEISTLRQILKAARLWGNIAPDVRMLPERHEIGRALSKDEESNLLTACKNSPSPSLYTAVIVFINTGLRNAELRKARWGQVDFLQATFQVGRAKTEGSDGRLIPLNKSALSALTEWRARWSHAKPEDFIFPTEKLKYDKNGVMISYAVDPAKPLGSWKRAWNTAKKQAGVKCRIHDLRHSFISKLAETQTPDATIQAISGHLSRKMLEHYSHVRQEAKRQAVALLDAQTVQAIQ